jgi:P-type Ca2+ transporter type 2C
MDGPPAQSLGVEPVSSDVIRQPPRPADEPVITYRLLRRIFVSAVAVVSGTMYILMRELAAADAMKFAAETAGISSVVAIETARRRVTTMTFTCFVLFDMINAASCRSTDKSIFSIPPFGNTFFLWAASGSLLGQIAVVYFPPLQAIFQTTSIDISDWFLLIGLASLVLWVDEFMKLVDSGMMTRFFDLFLRGTGTRRKSQKTLSISTDEGAGASGSIAMTSTAFRRL